MPGRGTNVGDVYVRVHADNSAFAAEVAKDMRGKGTNAGKTYGDEFYKGLKSSLKSKMEAEFKQGFLSGDFSAYAKNFGTLDKAMDNVNQRLATMRRWGGMTRDQFDDLTATTKRFTKAAEEAAKQKLQYKDVENYSERLTEAARRMGLFEDSARRSHISVRRLGIEMSRIKFREDLDLPSGFERALERRSKSIRGFGSTMGRVFGLGSRNNFLNFFGSLVSGAASIPAMFVDISQAAFKGFRAIGLGFDTLVENFQNAQGAGAKIASVFQTIGPPALQAATAVASIAVAIGGAMGIFYALGGVVQILTSLMSALAGGITIVVSALGIALVGAAGAAIPVLVGLAAGIGVVTLAFSSMSDEQKKAFEPLKKKWEDYGKSVAKIFLKDMPTWLKTAENLLKTFVGPTMEGIATEMTNAITGITKEFEKPGVKKALDAWRQAIAPIAGDITTAFGQASVGALAFFTPLLGPAKELSGWIEKSMTDFNAWATSADGQQSIRVFFEDAWGKAKSLGTSIGNVTTALGTLMTAASPSADRFLTWLDTKTTQLKDFLNSPEGQNKLADWFKEAERMGGNLWTTVEKIGGWLDSMVTPENLANANKLVIALGQMADALKLLGPAFTLGGTYLMAFLGLVAVVIGDAMSKLGAWMMDVGGLFILLGNVPGFDWAKKFGEDMVVAGASTGAFGEELKKLPDKVKMAFEGDTSDLENAKGRADELGKPPDPVVTQFDGDTGQLSVAAQAALIATGTVPKTWVTDFSGEHSALGQAAIASQAEIDRVHDENVTQFKGDKAPLAGTVGQANAAIDGVKTSHVTTFDGNASPLLAKIANARAEIAGLMNFNVGALGNADLGGASGLVAGWAGGGLTRGAQIRLIGEDGPEAVVPLRRSLDRVDPSVRELSAFAQGMTPSKPGVTIADGAIRVVVPNADPKLAAEAVLDRLVGLLT